MPLTFVNLKQKADFMMSLFELYHFQNRLGYSRGVNLLFEFCDYIDQMPEWKLLAELESEDPKDVVNFREMIHQGIDYWLSGSLKTINL